MTLIIALKDKNWVSIWGDRFWSNFWFWSEMIDEKVFQVWDLIFWCCGSFRVMNIIQHHFSPPERGAKVDNKTYMYKYVLEELKKVLNEKNVSQVEKNLHEWYPILIAYEKDIYLLQEDFSMLQHDSPFMAIGSGSPFAYWFLEAIFSIIPNDNGKKWRADIITKCILWTQKHCPSVRWVGSILSQ